MCGITGFLDFARAMSPGAQADACGRMTAALAHRGPDDTGVWTDAAAGVAFGHRRLSIIDLSPLGHQPMVSGSGRYVITFNGEVYNFGDLRAELTGYPFRGRSDTEVILASFEAWGVEKALARFNGMFALAVWDTRDRALWLARDRFGEKPLYYGRAGRSLVFGSELKAIQRHPDFVGEVNRGALAQLLRFGYVPAPGSIFRGVRKLPAASCLRIATEADLDAAPSTYWSMEDVAREGTQQRFTGSTVDATAELDRLLREAVKLRMVSDVPLGAFLSGGIDSSTVVAMMQAAGNRPVRTFTIGFTETAYNEADSAKAVAQAPRHRAHRAVRDARAGAGGHPEAYPRSMTSRSPIRRRCRPSSSRSSRAGTSRCRSRATEATSCSAGTTGTCGPSRCGGT